MRGTADGGDGEAREVLPLARQPIRSRRPWVWSAPSAGTKREAVGGRRAQAQRGAAAQDLDVAEHLSVDDLAAPVGGQ